MTASPQPRALISVWNKDGITDFAKALADRGISLVSTGGTARALSDAGLNVTGVSEVTGFPEILDGRVKTLHPKIHGGLLARRDLAEHRHALETHDIAGIDLLIVNLYPFVETRAASTDRDEIVEMIDIGGPAMIRAAAKNHRHVTVLVDPSDYPRVLKTLDHGGVSETLKRELAGKAFAHTAAYDAAIAAWFAEDNETLPDTLTLTAKKALDLRYGENPHQTAAFYSGTADAGPGIATAEQIQGKALSFNNINDTDAAVQLVSEFGTEQPAVVIVKHANPCGVALGHALEDAYSKAFACDRTSAFGGIIAVNRPLDGASAKAMTEIFTEVVIAPDADADARAIFAERKNLRLLLTGGLPDPSVGGPDLRTVSGGYLLQDRDAGRIGADDLHVVTKRAPTEHELSDLLFAWRVAKHVKSNAIVYAKDQATVGIGAGQMSRVDSTRIAARKAKDAQAASGAAEPATIGSVVASDAFFPFADGLMTAAEAGATALIQPGGSVRDKEVIAAADDRDLAMVFTGMRHFRH
ncbi:MAG: bifunctional phosphoribosylaminoimidazolecarboxamide formyltransferase/IMP cyclohydrolase [Pseudomonadota bacterium]